MKATSLTENEKAQLHRLEAAVEAGVKASIVMIEAGKALAEIRTRQLYRDSAASWEEYVDRRFRITRRRADQLIAFAGVKAALDEMGTAVPDLSESAARTLVGLPAEDLQVVVAEAAAGPEGITPASIKKAASRRKAAKAKVRRPQRWRVPGAIVIVQWNRKATGTASDALAAAMRQAAGGDQANEAA